MTAPAGGSSQPAAVRGGPAMTALAAVVLAAACGGGTVSPSPEPPAEAPRLSTIVIDAFPALLPGDGFETSLTARALDQRGRAMGPGTFDPISWSSSDPTVALVAPSTGELVTGGHGTASIVASSGAVSASADVNVLATTGFGIPEIDIEMARLFDQGGMEGGAFGVVLDGRLVMARGYGFADVATRVPVQPSSEFRIASVSKSITGVAAMRLLEQGRLSLSDNVMSIVGPTLSGGPPVDSRVNDLTIEHLVHHFGGWDRSISGNANYRLREIAAELAVASPPTRTEFLEWLLLTQPLDHTPGSRYVYSNRNYQVLGQVIEVVGGKSYEDVVREQVLAPLGMTQTRVGKTRLEDRGPSEVRYHFPGTGPSIFDSSPGNVGFPYGAGIHLDITQASGGWVSTIIDLARFAIGVDGDENTPELLAPTSFATMIEDPGTGYLVGWFVNPSGRLHTGAIEGATSILLLRPDGMILVGLLNTSTINVDIFGEFNRIVRRDRPWTSQDLFDVF